MEKELYNPVAPGLGTNQYRFFVSDAADKFIHIANSVMKYGVLSAKLIHIEEY